MAIVMKLDEIGKDFTFLAIEKIDKETESFSGDRYGNAVYKFVAQKLKDFCQESNRFAEVVYKTKRTLSDCTKEIMKGCGQHIPDLEVYRKAAQFYFPNTRLGCVMTIEFTGDEPDDSYLNKEAPKEKENPVKNNTPKKVEKPVKEKKPKKEKPESIQLTLF